MKFHTTLFLITGIILPLLSYTTTRSQEELLKEVDNIITRALRPGNPPIALNQIIEKNENPDALLSFEDLFYKANDFFNQNKIDDAIIYYLKAIERNNQVPQGYFNLGVSYTKINNSHKAILAFEKAIALKANYAKAHLFLARLLEPNHRSRALEHYLKAIESGENSPDAHLATGKLLNSMDRYQEGIGYIENAHRLSPDNHTILFELAITYNTLNHNQKALDLYQQLITKNTENSAILYNIAFTLKKLGRIDEAMMYYDKVIAKEPDHVNARFSRSLAYLVSGNFKDGWQEYEWRWKRDGFTHTRTFTKPEWDGSDLQGKTILIHAEQGLGDTFQFIRYAKIAKEKNGRVVVACQQPLIHILKLCPYIDEIHTLKEQLPRFDVQAALLSLPRILKTHTQEAIPHEIPYLFASEKLKEEWKEKLAPYEENFKVGICWQGNSDYHNSFLRAAVAEKSMSLNKFLDFTTIPHIKLFSLQRVTGENQISDLDTDHGIHIFDMDFDTERFMDTAAVISNLDVMVTIDTSIAHLAAGLGCKVLLMLPEPADWRWLLNRHDSPWYPTMELFRQPTTGDWDSVITAVKTRLIELSNAKKNTIETNTIGKLIDDMVRLEIAWTFAENDEERNIYLEQQERVRSRLPGTIAHKDFDDSIHRLAQLNLALWKMGTQIKKTTRKPLDAEFSQDMIAWTMLTKEKEMVTQNIDNLFI